MAVHSNIEPDTQERINDDATMYPHEYCKKRGIQAGPPDNAPFVVLDFVEPMALDLLHRQRELDTRTMGGGDTFKHNRKCVWSVDDDGSWDTGCGNKAIWDDDGMRPAYCPWCGGTVVDDETL